MSAAPAIARHDRLGYWVAEAGAASPSRLAGDADADVVVVGGGYTGLWTALTLLREEPGLQVVVLEAEERCGLGPSGRNGGFVNSLWYSLPRLLERHGADAALALCRASAESVRAIGAFCEEEDVDAWFRPAPHLLVATAAAQDGGWDAAVAACAAVGAPDEHVAIDAAAVQAICASPRFRAGALMRTAATVQPARLAAGLRAAVLRRGAVLGEGARVRRLVVDGARAPVVAELDGGGVVRAGALVVAAGSAASRLAPLRGHFTVGSSHMIVTEPVPDVVEALGWTGGEAISDERALLHYTRTTPDGRIAFGWAGGQMAFGTRVGGRVEVDGRVAAETARRLVSFFPALAGRRIEHAWGGPIDVAPDHLPEVGRLPGRAPAFFALGFTGNGVGPTHLAGRVLAALALDRRDALTRLALVEPAHRPRVPPEPFRWLGGTAIRAAFLREEATNDAGAPAGPLTRAVAGLPARLGVHVGR